MILLLRHGRTEANAGGLLLGRADPALDALGEQQAAALAAAVGAGGTARTGRVARVVSSPLRRCRQTAEVVAASLGVPLVEDERWIELDYGALDGTPVAEVPPETWAAWTADTAWAPEGGESLAALGERVRSACDHLVSAGSGTETADVVVVTHVSPIKAAVAWALGVGDDIAWRLYVAPASITRVAVSGARRSLHSFNETAHLDQGPDATGPRPPQPG